MTQDQITAIQQVLAKYQSNQSEDNLMVLALTDLVNLAHSGYQSDQQAIADEVTKRVGDVRAQNVTLAQQVSDLTASNTEKDTTIGDLQGQVTTLTTGLATADDTIASLTSDNTAKDGMISDLTAQVATITPPLGGQLAQPIA